MALPTRLRMAVVSRSASPNTWTPGDKDDTISMARDSATSRDCSMADLAAAIRNLVGNAIHYSDPGPRHPQERAGADLRAVLPHRCRPVPRHRRHRPGPGHRQAHLRQPRRRGHGLARGGPRLDVHDASAGGPHERRRGTRHTRWSLEGPWARGP